MDGQRAVGLNDALSALPQRQFHPDWRQGMSIDAAEVRFTRQHRKSAFSDDALDHHGRLFPRSLTRS
jgi:hypothetical protein